jgi:tRNA(fMet)-specific endonuclease VapC
MKECLIDTDTLSYYLKGDKIVIKNLQEYLYKSDFNKITISEITYFEILAGLEYRKARKQIQTFEKFISTCKIVKLSTSSLRKSAIEYAKLRRKGIMIGVPDLLIAGIAIDNDFILVTNNEKHFEPIYELQTLNWSK